MANNRLYLRCKNCGEELYVGKNFGEPYFISEEKLKEINQFLEDHAFCTEADDSFHIAHGGWFELYDEYHDDEPDPKYAITALIAGTFKEK